MTNATPLTTHGTSFVWNENIFDKTHSLSYEGVTLHVTHVVDHYEIVTDNVDNDMMETGEYVATITFQRLCDAQLIVEQILQGNVDVEWKTVT